MLFRSSNLKNTLGGGIITLIVDDSPSKNDLISTIKQIEFVQDVSITENKITIFASKGTDVAPLIFSISSNFGVKIRSISITQPTLDDVFLSFTGHDLRDDNTKKSYDRRKEYRKIQRMKS